MSKINDRKLQHIDIVRHKQVEPGTSSFDSIGQLPFKALPQINLSDINTSFEFLGHNLNMPFVISSMTGGPQKASTINKNLAIAAQKTGVALGLGSMRVILRDESAIKSFAVKKYCPDVPLLANMGLVQLNYGYTHSQINKIIDSINADGIFLHINALQEAIQPEGDTNFDSLIEKLEKVLPKIEKPVVVKEVGCGVDRATALSLAQIGVKWIDVAGLGGTSWPWVESYRRNDTIGEPFADFGISTVESLKQCADIKNLSLIAGGGVRNGVHIAKALYCGAKMATAAKPLLEPALAGADDCINVISNWNHQLKIAMFACGWKSLASIPTNSS